MQSTLRANLPNFLTFFRVASAPIFALIFFFNGDGAKFIAGILFVLAGLSDFFDGYFARAWSVQSKFGKILDPVADKLLILSALVMLVAKGLTPGIHVFAVITILLREVAISGVREVLNNPNLPMSPNMTGKWKTTFQITGIIALIFGDIEKLAHYLPWTTFLIPIGLSSLWLSAILGVVSAFQYLRSGFIYLR